MTNPALGTRRICASCERPFYDLARDPARCPKCDTVFVMPTARAGRRPVRTPVKPRPAVALVAEEPAEQEADTGGVPLLDDEEEEAEDEAMAEETAKE